MKPNRLMTALGGALLLACASGGASPEPEAEENPIVFRFRALAAPEAVEVIARACSDEGIQVQVVDPAGYVESRWSDIAGWYPSMSESYRLPERQVQYRFEVREAGERSLQLSIAAYYQPFRPSGVVLRASRTYDRLVPTDHPAYRLAQELRTRIRMGLRSEGATLVEEGR